MFTFCKNICQKNLHKKRFEKEIDFITPISKSLDINDFHLKSLYLRTVLFKKISLNGQWNLPVIIFFKWNFFENPIWSDIEKLPESWNFNYNKTNTISFCKTYLLTFIFYGQSFHKRFINDLKK